MTNVFYPGDNVYLVRNNMKGVVVKEHEDEDVTDVYLVQFDGVPQPVLVKAKGLDYLDNKEDKQ